MNKFIPFTPAFDDDFINRELEIKRILTGISKGINLAVVGNPHIGKTSLLSKSLDTFFNSSTDKAHCALVEIDFQIFGEKETAHDFWKILVREAVENNPDVSDPLKLLLENNKLDAYDLLKAFKQIGRTKGKVVVFLDEFDFLFNLENFRNLEFLGPLRTIIMKSRGLKVVTASRLSVSEMSALVEKYQIATRGSDFFNYLNETGLTVFSDDVVDKWFASQDIDKKYTHEIKKIAGHHPLLLQIAGEIFCEICEEQNQEDILSRLNNEFIERARSQFDDVWRYLSDKAQIALVIFALKELSGKADASEFNLKEAEDVLSWYSSEIEKMVRYGTLEVDKERKYVFGSDAFYNWIIKEKIIGTHDDEPQKTFQKWLYDKEFKLGDMITSEEIAFLQKACKVIPSDIQEAQS